MADSKNRPSETLLDRIRESTQMPEERSLLDYIRTGLQRSSTAAPFITPDYREAPTFASRLAESAGELAGDIPAMAGGGSLGALGGAALGSLLGPAGAGIGALLGGGAGAFAAPQAVKSAAQEARKGSPLSDIIGQALYEAGKSGIVGATTGAAGKLAGPLLKATGSKAAQRLLSSALGRGATQTAGELGGMTYGQHLVGEKPSLEGLAQNALLLGALKGAGGLSKKLPIKRTMPTNFETVFTKSPQRQEYFKMLKEHVGNRNAKLVESDFKWRDSLANAEKDGKFTPDELEDMIYYRQKTGNPGADIIETTEEGNEKKVLDTYKDVSERLPESAKNFVDNVIDKHLNESLKTWNDNPILKQINPRQSLEGIYLPGLYDASPEQIRKTVGEFRTKFGTKNPFANSKEFLTYLDAFKKMGLKPRYNNIVDMIKHYDRVMIKASANAEFIQKIKDLEKATGQKLIVRPTSKLSDLESHATAKEYRTHKEAIEKLKEAPESEHEALKREGQESLYKFNKNKLQYLDWKKRRKSYDTARNSGYIPFDDVVLRGDSDSPALVNPELADAIQGIFNKDVYKPDSTPMKYYDAISDTLKRMQVHIPLVDRIPGFSGSPWSMLASPFHAFALTEHGIGDLGIRFRKWKNIGKAALKNKEAVTDAVRHGVTIHGADVEGGRGKTYLFGTYQPSLKLGSYNKFVQDTINKLSKQGTPPEASQITEIKHQAADFVNNLYGGQNWETLNWFNDPKNLKKARRATGYLDWSTSALRTAGMPFKADYKGAQARKMWMRYGAFYFGSRALLDAFNNSLVQTDKDNSPLGVRMDKQKFMDNLSLVGKPGQEHLFALPDVPVRIGGYDFNFGRDEEGARKFGHFGKSALEIGHYFTKPLTEIFNKANPVFQHIYKQVIGSSPSEYGAFPVRVGYRYGQKAPWKGKEGYDQFAERVKELATGVVPFSLRKSLEGLIDSGPKRAIEEFASAAGGAFPINKGLTPFKARSYFQEALASKDVEKLNEIKAQLRENGYTNKKINREISLVRGDLEKRGIIEKIEKHKRKRKKATV